PPSSTLFHYTTLFRSRLQRSAGRLRVGACAAGHLGEWGGSRVSTGRPIGSLRVVLCIVATSRDSGPAMVSATRRLAGDDAAHGRDRKSTRLNSSHVKI